MRLFISGGYHQDPVHRERLLNGMRLLRSQFGVPAFVAVEANCALFKAVIMEQRKLFIALAQQDQEMAAVPDTAKEVLSKAMLYEADTHEEVFGKALKILWLDDCRTDFDEILDPCNTARRYLQLCRHALKKCDNTTDHREVLSSVSAFITEQARSHSLESNKILREKFFSETRSNPYERDEIWAEVISKSASPQSGYAIIVVGVPHAFDEERYLGALLKEQGHDCQLRLLAETGDEPPTSWSS